MFRKTILSKEGAQRLLRHMKDDPPNLLAKAALEQGRKILRTRFNFPEKETLKSGRG